MERIFECWDEQMRVSEEIESESANFLGGAWMMINWV